MSYLSDFGRLKVPNSGKPEFGAGEGGVTRTALAVRYLAISI